MDNQNRFHTNSTWCLVRAEALLLLGVLLALLMAFRHDVRWGRFCFAFLIIDVVGYLPGALAFRRTVGRQTGALQPAAGRVHPIYHLLYNLTHSFLTMGAVLAAWALWLGKPEWAMLALPIHLLGDRGVFGNVYKPTELPFEPAAESPRLHGGAAPVQESL